MQKAKIEHRAKNRVMVAKLHSVIESLLAEMLVHGFFGAGTVKFIVRDGTIQHIEECAQRKHCEQGSTRLQGAGWADLQQQGNGHPKSSLPSAASRPSRSVFEAKQP